MMRFIEWPVALALFIVLPALGFIFFNLERRSRSARLGKLGTRPMLVRLAPEGAPVGMWRIVRLTLALALCGLAFAGPRWGLGPSESHTSGADVVLALDASLSMMAKDAQPTRLENMKNVIRQLHTLSPDDRFAILAFAGHSYILTPLTSDPSAIDLYIDKLDPNTVGVAGSSIANALHQANTLVGTKKENDRAIIVMSDGESFEPVGAVTEEAKQAGDAGVSVITVGFGTTKGDSIPVDSAGKHTFKKDRGGNVVVTQYNPEYLNAAAQAAHGTFIPADAANKPAQIRKVLDKLKTTPRAATNGNDLLYQFEWFLIPALLLLALDTILVLRPRRRQLAAVRNAALAAGALATAACHKAPEQPTKAEVAAKAAADSARAELALLKVYNRGTKGLGSLALIKKDTLLTSNKGVTAAQVLLDSATVARTKDVRQSALYNAGWSRIALAGRLMGIIPTPKDSAVGDTSLKGKGSAPGAAKNPGAVASAQNGTSSPGASGADTNSAGEDMSDSAVKQRKADSIASYIGIAKKQYRTYLATNSKDNDARWNYELTLLLRQQASRSKSKPSQAKKKPQKQEPPPRQFRLPPQQARQLLDAASQREQSPSNVTPKPAATIPGGKDW